MSKERYCIDKLIKQTNKYNFRFTYLLYFPRIKYFFPAIDGRF